MSPPFLRIDLSHLRNVYAVGDIHGCFRMLEAKLETIGFDPEKDALISVGDLVDRGPESDRALEFCRKPWFYWVRGNHEELLRIFVTKEQNYTKEKAIKNGMGWFINFPEDIQQEFVQVLNDAPVIMEVITPNAKRCGFVHAAFPSDDWRFAEEIAVRDSHSCLWDRTDVHNPKPNGIRYIDYVFHGHTPLQTPRTVANVVWLDTSACRAGGTLTVVKLP